MKARGPRADDLIAQFPKTGSEVGVGEGGSFATQ